MSTISSSLRTNLSWYVTVHVHLLPCSLINVASAFFASAQEEEEEEEISRTKSEVWTSCILQHTPLLISDRLYQQLHYSLHPATSWAFIGTVEYLERSGMTQQDTATSKTFFKVTLKNLKISHCHSPLKKKRLSYGG